MTPLFLTVEVLFGEFIGYFSSSLFGRTAALTRTDYPDIEFFHFTLTIKCLIMSGAANINDRIFRQSQMVSLQKLLKKSLCVFAHALRRELT